MQACLINLAVVRFECLQHRVVTYRAVNAGDFEKQELIHRIALSSVVILALN